MMRGEGGVGESSSRARAKTQRGKENSEIFMRDMQENRKSQAHDACVWEWEKKKKSIILIRGLAAERLYIKHLLSAASVTARCWFPYTRASILCSTGRHLHQNRGVRGGWEYIKPSSVVWSCTLYEAVQICVCVCAGQFLARRQTRTEGVLEQMFEKDQRYTTCFFWKIEREEWVWSLGSRRFRTNLVARCPLVDFSVHCCTHKHGAASCECREGVITLKIRRLWVSDCQLELFTMKNYDLIILVSVCAEAEEVHWSFKCLKSCCCFFFLSFSQLMNYWQFGMVGWISFLPSILWIQLSIHT